MIGHVRDAQVKDLGEGRPSLKGEKYWRATGGATVGKLHHISWIVEWLLI